MEFKQREIKGAKLVEKRRFEWAAQRSWMSDEQRRAGSRAFLTKGLEKKSPSRDEFTAFGQASLEMARGVFQILRACEATLFAACIPTDISRPSTVEAAEYLRKDQVFLFERFYYFLQDAANTASSSSMRWNGADLKFVRQIERYFTRTQTGRCRTSWIVPTPLFVASGLAYTVQAADLCIYAINWGFSLPGQGDGRSSSEEIASEFGQWLADLQYPGQGQRGALSPQLAHLRITGTADF